jgi:hypothetical protein
MGWVLLINLPKRDAPIAAETRVQDQAELKIGMVYFYPPFVYNESVGFDVLLGSKLCRQAGYHCRVVHESLNALLTDLQQHKLDMVISALALTKERTKQFDFTESYLVLKHPSFVGLKSLGALSQLKKFKIGVIQGSLFETYLDATPIKGARIVPYQYNEDLLAALVHKEIDLILTDAPVANYWVNKMNRTSAAHQLVLFSGPIGFPEQQLAIAVNKGDLLLQNRLNQALAAIARQGAYKKMVDLYFDANEIVVPAELRG